MIFQVSSQYFVLQRFFDACAIVMVFISSLPFFDERKKKKEIVRSATERKQQERRTRGEENQPG